MVATPLRTALKPYKLPRFKLEGKTAIITGAGHGIGLSLTKLLLKRSVTVVLADTHLSTEARALLSTNPPVALYKQTDVSSPASLKALFEFHRKELGKEADIVVPNAGVYEPEWSNFWGEEREEGAESLQRDAGGQMVMGGGYYKSLRVNLGHPLFATRLAIEGFLRERKEGRVVCVSSIAAQIPNILTPLYCAAKAGINHFVRTLAPLDERLNFRITACAPGLVRTPLWTAPEHADKLAWIDQEKDTWIEPEEVAACIVELIEGNFYKGGSVVEVTKGQRREVQCYNDPGPQGKSISLSRGNDHVEELLKGLEAKLGRGYLEGFT
ncbi:NAD(P)-binding protein [Ascobolus immersus RN42]|uniref:NAD(P)-binding protein n=1 Tax=Ascobolus immersus RN42 TaxID=1160509 RepID=A0A3N4IF39_ASCIM|nr:NAD(P)-binding protein [Ascobolus immersus RN42]